MRSRTDPLERYSYLSAVQDENETLFHHVVLHRLEEIVPIIYTPTVGQACLEWSLSYLRPRGMYLPAAQHRGRVADVLRRWPRRASIIVVTDGGPLNGPGAAR